MEQSRQKPSNYNVFVHYPPDDIYIAFNCVSGGLYVLNKQHYEVAQKCVTEPESIVSNDTNGIKEKLIAGRFLIDSDYDELQILKMRNNISRYNPNGISMVIAPTLFCNLDCPYCYVDRDKNKMNRQDMEAVKKFFKGKIKTSTEAYVSWTGGEPLLALDVIEELNTFFSELCESEEIYYEPNIVTNGYLLSSENIERLKACGIVRVQITLDGSEKYHDKLRYRPGGGPTFETILKHVVLASNSGLKVTLRTNIEKTNYQGIYSLIDTLTDSDLNLENTYFVPCAVSDIKTDDCQSTQCNPYTNAEFSAIEPEILFYAAQKGFRLGKGVLSTKKAYCGANTLPLHVIDSKANVLKCWCNLGRAEKNMVGKLKEDGNMEYTNLKNLGRWMGWDPFDIPECRECSVLPLCMGGCMYHNVMGETNEIDIGCSHRKHNLEKILKVFYLSAVKTPEELKKIDLNTWN